MTGLFWIGQNYEPKLKFIATNSSDRKLHGI